MSLAAGGKGGRKRAPTLSTIAFRHAELPWRNVAETILGITRREKAVVADSGTCVMGAPWIFDHRAVLVTERLIAVTRGTLRREGIKKGAQSRSMV